MTKARNPKTEKLIARIQHGEDRRRAQRMVRIKRALAGAELLDWEITQVESIVFGAYGRTKLSA